MTGDIDRVAIAPGVAVQLWGELAAALGQQGQPRPEPATRSVPARAAVQAGCPARARV